MSLNNDEENTEKVNLLEEEEEEKEKEKKPKFLSSSQLWWLLKLGLSEWFLITIGTIFLFITAGSGLILPSFVGSLVDQVSHANENGKIWLTQISLILFGIFLIQGIATFIRAYSFSIAGERIVANLRRNLFNSTICQDISFFDKTKTGELLNRLASDTKVLESTVTVNFSMASRYMIQLIGGIVLLFYLSWKLTLIMLAAIPLIACTAIIYGRWVKSLGKRYQDALARTTDIAEESLGNVRTVRSFAQEVKQKNTYGEAIDESFRLAKLLSIARGTFGGVMMILGNISVIGVVWYGGTLVIDGEMTMGSLTSFIIYTLTVAFAFGALSSLYFDVSQAIGATERVYGLIHREPSIDVGEGGRIIQHQDFQGNISFKNVEFSYPTRPDQTILKQLNLELKTGEVLALVGESGGGKSTVASLIQRYYDVDEGVIEIDGVPLKDLDYVWYRKQIAAVNQEPSLFGYTIEENIAFGKIGDVSETEIIEAAKKSNAHDFIMDFPEGYKTIVGERGVRLSGGQKQRIAIARALLKNPKILVLDEFSSALDAQSEFLVQQALNRLMKGRTCLIIAHRLSTVKNSNVVCVVEKGEIIEQGNHEELLNKNGTYAKFVERQLLLGSQEINNKNEENNQIE